MTRIIVDESTYNAVQALGKPRRPNVKKFQDRLRGLTLAHGTSGAAAMKIRAEGFKEEYNYFCCGTEGWEMDEKRTVHVLINGESVYDRCYPDPEGQWGEWESIEHALDRLSLEHLLDRLEESFDCGELVDWDDPTDPENYNLVVIGPIEVGLILREVGR